MPDSSPKLPPTPPSIPVVREIVALALREDLSGGDLTTDATVPAHVEVVATAMSKSPLVCCGNDVVREAFEATDSRLQFEVLVADGTRVQPGRPLWTVSGSARSVLMAERTALNFAQQLSGVATLAHRYVREVPVGCSTRITDTRKTLPGLRPLQRYAVRTGGAHNHRDDLGAAVLIKDNHIEAAGGIDVAVRRARMRAPHTCKVEVEVTSFEQLAQALEAGADIVMLDNFAPSAIREAVLRVSGRALIEVSGNVTLDRIGELARAGADVISVGALTHSAPASDISLKLALSEH